MELRQVEYVVGVIDHGGFTRAAAELHVTQPSLSQGIRTLEAELGVALFHRLGRSVTLTSAGAAFEAPARQLLRDVRTVTAAVAAVRGMLAGTLDLVALPTLAVDPLSRLIGAFRSAHPAVAVRVVSPESAAGVVELIREGRCEVGLTELPVPDDLETERILSQEILAVCPPGTSFGAHDRLPVASLSGVDLVTTPPGTSTRRLVDEALAGASVTAKVAVETAHREAILPLVLAGAGTAFLPESLARAAAAQGAVVARLDPPMTRSIGTLHRRGPLSPAAAAFIELAAATAGGGHEPD
jgi:DNA-binding transcriptional LysR family regulator